MKFENKNQLDFTIDKLTNSIENLISGDTFQTEISILTKEDLIQITKKNNWEFDWKFEYKNPKKDVYKLTIINNINVIQGLVCLEVMQDHVYMHLVESAPFNKGKNKLYAGVAGNLVAFVCKKSFQMGYDGNIAFTAKTQLIDHYSKTLGASHIGRSRMVIETEAALILTNKYFK